MSDPHFRSPTVRYNARVGMVLFIVYLAIYAGFVALSAFAPSVMAKPFLAGVNLAIVYGFALIGLALALAIVYLMLCRTDSNDQGGAS